MPLSAVNFVPLTGQIKAADIKQFFDLFTGAMTDQPVTLANTLTVGGSQGAGAAPVRINGVAAQTANMVEARALSADVQPIFSIGPTGTLAWGPGGATGTDVSLRRSAANQLTLQGLAGTPALVIPVGGLQVTAGNVGIGVAPGTARISTLEQLLPWALASLTMSAGGWTGYASTGVAVQVVSVGVTTVGGPIHVVGDIIMQSSVAGQVFISVWVDGVQKGYSRWDVAPSTQFWTWPVSFWISLIAAGAHTIAIKFTVPNTSVVSFDGGSGAAGVVVYEMR